MSIVVVAVIQTLGWVRQSGHGNLKASVGYKERSCLKTKQRFKKSSAKQHNKIQRS